MAAGADGLIIEVHCDPDHALSDGAQSLFPAQFDRLMAELRIIAPAIGRSICLEPVMRRGWRRRWAEGGSFSRNRSWLPPTMAHGPQPTAYGLQVVVRL